MQNFKGYSTEKRLSGLIARGGSEAILGRVRFFDESYTEGSILCVRGEESVDRETLLLCPPIAVIVFCQDSSPRLSEICSLGVPCIVLNDEEADYRPIKSKIALIDTERGILIVDPSIETLEFYSSAQKRKNAPFLDCTVGKILTANTPKCSDSAEAYLISASRLAKNDTFEAAVALWESLCPELLVLDISIPTCADGAERRFAEQVEDIFRAALYGSLAISLSGFNCESDLSVAMRLLHKSFCMLEAEGREFNGYLPRGITISSPLWLMRPSPVTNPDFIIFDLDILLPSLFSLSADEIIIKEKALKKELFSVLERYFSSFAPRCDIFLRTSFFANTPLLRDLVRFADAKIVFLG